MKRLISAIVICAVLGAMSSIATTLVVTARSSTRSSDLMNPVTATDIIRARYPNTPLPNPPVGTIDHGFGVSERLVSTAAGNSPAVTIHVVSAGWPLRCLYGEHHIIDGREEYWWSKPHDSLAFLDSGNQRPIPAKIIPAGLIGNVLLHGGTLFIIWLIIGRLRRKPE